MYVCNQMTGTGTLTAALFTISPNWEQVKYPTTVEWIIKKKKKKIVQDCKSYKKVLKGALEMQIKTS